jgi:hypothetical protein
MTAFIRFFYLFAKLLSTNYPLANELVCGKPTLSTGELWISR